MNGNIFIFFKFFKFFWIFWNFLFFLNFFKLKLKKRPDPKWISTDWTMSSRMSRLRLSILYDFFIFLNEKLMKFLKFLANEYLNLRKHVSERTLNILKQVKVYENANQQKLYQGLVEEASKEIDKVEYFSIIFFFFFKIL